MEVKGFDSPSGYTSYARNEVSRDARSGYSCECSCHGSIKMKRDNRPGTYLRMSSHSRLALRSSFDLNNRRTSKRAMQVSHSPTNSGLELSHYYQPAGNSDISKRPQSQFPGGVITTQPHPLSLSFQTTLRPFLRGAFGKCVSCDNTSTHTLARFVYTLGHAKVNCCLAYWFSIDQVHGNRERNVALKVLFHPTALLYFPSTE